VRGDDGIRVIDYRERRLIEQYRGLDERNQRSIRIMAKQLGQYATNPAAAPTPKRRRGTSDVDTLKQWKGDMGKLARGGQR
jgi:hypothetical protein